MNGARMAHKGLVQLYLLGVTLQFLLAGFFVFAGDSIDAHRIIGQVLQLVALAVLVLAFVGRLPSREKAMSVVLFVLTALQTVLVLPDDAPRVRALHVLNAFLAAAVAVLLGHGRSSDTPPRAS